MLTGALFLMIVGTLLNNTELFAMAGALIALCILSYSVAKMCARHLTVLQDAPDLVAAGQPFDIVVTLGGTRLTHEMRFDVSLALPEGVELLEVEKLDESGRRAIWRCRAVAKMRGAHQIGDMTVTVEDPVGLISLKKRASGEKELLAWPEPLDPGKHATLQAGTNPAGYQDTGKRAQDGSSIYSVRQWAPGDTPRRVHWPSTARLGKLAVLEFEADSATDLLVILDRRPPASAEGFETACQIASFLLHERWEAGQQGRLSLGRQIVGEGPGRTGSLPRMEALGALARTRPDCEESLEQAIVELSPVLRHMSNTVVLTTRWDEDARKALAGLSRFQAAGAGIVVDMVVAGGQAPSPALTIVTA